MSDYLQLLDNVVRDVVGPSAEETDRSGRFPKANIDALAQAGLLGLISSKEVGGLGRGIREASEVVERLAEACGSTAMIMMMHYAATPTIEAFGPRDIREAIAGGKHLATLAFSEAGSRSHFWTPVSSARKVEQGVRLDAHKSWVTSAGQASSYVWSSRPLAAEGQMTLWLVPSGTVGLSQPSGFDGLGLRGNGSTPVTAQGAIVQEAAMLGEDGKGLDSVMGLVLPIFQVLSASVSLGLMEAVTAQTARHLELTRYEHLDRAIGQSPATRLELARMRLTTDRERGFLQDTLMALEDQRPDATLRVLEVKASAAEATLEVTDMAMKLCGGSAFRKELGIERHFRDAQAARVMAPTTDALLDFVGRSLLGQPLLDEAVP